MSITSKLQYARQCFLKGEYLQSIEHYIEAGMVIGHEHVQANIKLCEENMRAALEPNKSYSITDQAKPGYHALESQLCATQLMLEEYYARYQQLKLESENI